MTKEEVEKLMLPYGLSPSGSIRSETEPEFVGLRTQAAHSVRMQWRLQEIIVFGILVLLGGVLLSVVLIAHVDYFFPYMFYLVVVWFAWQRYFQAEAPKSSRDYPNPEHSYPSGAKISTSSLKGTKLFIGGEQYPDL